MLKVGDRVKNLAGVLGTITELNTTGGRTAAKLIWDNGQTTPYHVVNLEKYEEKTEQKMKEREASEYQTYLLAIYENMAFTDFTIICKSGGEEYKLPCQQAIIAYGVSDHFARMFGSGMG